MKNGPRLALLAAVALAAAAPRGDALAGRRSAGQPASWRQKVAAPRRGASRPRKTRRLPSIARRPEVVATAHGATDPALGLAGPLGPYGPLGRLGPAIDTAWSPSRWMRAIGQWRRLSMILTELGGPLGEEGPLGPDGPQGDARARFPRLFLPGGTLAALGPDGPLGALGPLGPLGPMGAHGFRRDPQGRYLDGDRVRRTVSVPYRGGRRTYPLFEVYDADLAAGMADNDSSFMAVGRLRRAGDSYEFPFRAGRGEAVQVTLTPHAQLDRFRLEIVDGAGRVIATSERADQVNRVELRLPAGARLRARVSLAGSGHLLPDKPFSLAVVGRRR